MYEVYKLTPSEDYNPTIQSIYHNVIRHILLKNTTGYGVKTINIIKNTSVYDNHMLVDRFEQIPCKQEGTFSLDVTNTTSVYTDSFKPTGIYTDILLLEDTTPFDLQLELTVVKNTGSVNAKYCPIHLTWTKPPETTLNIRSFNYKTWDELKIELLEAL